MLALCNCIVNNFICFCNSKYFTKLPVFENLMEMNDEIESSTSSISNELDEAPPRHSFKRELASLSSPSSSMSTIRDVQVLYA